MLNIVNLGLTDYNKALKIQTALQNKRIKNQISNTLLLVEHTPVITLGTRGKTENIYAPPDMLGNMGVQIIETNRGGDVTYHGPGQIVAYPIFDLHDCKKDIRLFIQKTAMCIVNFLKDEFSINSQIKTGRFTGIWAEEEKIAAIGISVKKWVTMHGFALNINTDLSHFDWINPCGLNKGVTSVKKITGKEQDIKHAFLKVGEYFAAEFCQRIKYTDIGELL